MLCKHALHFVIGLQRRKRVRHGVVGDARARSHTHTQVRGHYVLGGKCADTYVTVQEVANYSTSCYGGRWSIFSVKHKELTGWHCAYKYFYPSFLTFLFSPLFPSRDFSARSVKMNVWTQSLKVEFPVGRSCESELKQLLEVGKKVKTSWLQRTATNLKVPPLPQSPVSALMRVSGPSGLIHYSTSSPRLHRPDDNMHCSIASVVSDYHLPSVSSTLSLPTSQQARALGIYKGQGVR